ncbi:hypothetical protein OPKNFCMD_5856 [Methylobacterium crusticola]|uniref:Uncharacterized protein n=1 Tax=Methylobacterium crusticola TaxID=1697972 RepID=A0ABQ4R5U9_9HYPH|nr:hypothetical protein OPKNFCMD_5856 [Methylobacterium crusticola]
MSMSTRATSTGDPTTVGVAPGQVWAWRKASILGEF